MEEEITPTEGDTKNAGKVQDAIDSGEVDEKLETESEEGEE